MGSKESRFCRRRLRDAGWFLHYLSNGSAYGPLRYPICTFSLLTMWVLRDWRMEKRKHRQRGMFFVEKDKRDPYQACRRDIGGFVNKSDSVNLSQSHTLHDEVCWFVSSFSCRFLRRLVLIVRSLGTGLWKAQWDFSCWPLRLTTFVFSLFHHIWLTTQLRVRRGGCDAVAFVAAHMSSSNIS